MDGNVDVAKPAVLEHHHQSPPRRLPPRHGAWGMAALPVPDDLLAEIFLRLPTPSDLVRASAAGVSFRRVVDNRSFLRRYRKLHAPPILGFIDYNLRVFHPAEPPHPSASAARAVALAADFSFSFLPAPASPADWWILRDIRGGRFLLESALLAFLSKEMVVCDPLHRRYILLPTIPEDLVAMVEKANFSETFLIPPGDGNDDKPAAAQETTFKVMRMVQCQAKLVSFLFSSSTGQWRAMPSHTWPNLLPGLVPLPHVILFCQRQYVYGCFYWLSKCVCEMKMLVLETQRMEFSIADPPSEAKDASIFGITMFEAGEGRPGMLVSGHDTSGHIYTIWRNNCGSSSQWQKDKIIRPSLGSEYMVRGSMGKYLVLNQGGNSSVKPGLYTLDIRTLQLERVCASTMNGCTYSNYPPSLSCLHRQYQVVLRRR